MTNHQLAMEICRREGKKVQVNIAQVKEILRVLCDIGREEYKKDQIAKANAVLKKFAPKKKGKKK